MIQVDGDKLKALLGAKGLKMAAVSRDMGHDSNYLSTATRKGAIRDHVAIYLRTVYGIEPEEYEAKEEHEPEPAPDPSGGEIVSFVFSAEMENHVYTAAVSIMEILGFHKIARSPILPERQREEAKA